MVSHQKCSIDACKLAGVTRRDLIANLLGNCDATGVVVDVVCSDIIWTHGSAGVPDGGQLANVVLAHVHRADDFIRFLCGFLSV